MKPTRQHPMKVKIEYLRKHPAITLPRDRAERLREKLREARKEVARIERELDEIRADEERKHPREWVHKQNPFESRITL